MADIFTSRDTQIGPSQQASVPSKSRSFDPAALLLVAIGVAIIPGIIVNLFINYKKAHPAVQTKAAVQTMHKTVTPSHMPSPTQRPQQTTPGEKTQEGRQSQPNFQAVLPQNWEIVRTAGNDTAYQLAVRQKGTGDNPIVINVYNNAASVPFDSFVQARIDQNATQERQDTKGKSVVYAKGDSIESYFIASGTTYYQISAVLGSPDIHNLFEKLYNTIN